MIRISECKCVTESTTLSLVLYQADISTAIVWINIDPTKESLGWGAIPPTDQSFIATKLGAQASKYRSFEASRRFSGWLHATRLSMRCCACLRFALTNCDCGPLPWQRPAVRPTKTIGWVIRRVGCNCDPSRHCIENFFFRTW